VNSRSSERNTRSVIPASMALVSRSRLRNKCSATPRVSLVPLLPHQSRA
jgi:hypothetical protein